MVVNKISRCFQRHGADSDAGLFTTVLRQRLLLGCTGLGTLGSVFGAALSAVFDTGSVESAAYDVVANTGKVLHTAAAHQHD